MMIFRFMNAKKCSLFLIISFLIIARSNSFAQINSIKIKNYFPEDSLMFQDDVEDVDYNFGAPLLGNTLKIIHCESNFGTFEFVFKKKIKKLTSFPGDSIEVYGAKGEIHKDYNPPFIVSEYDLYAMILTHDHGGILEKVKFQDFGTELYTPDFVLDHCFISDEDKNGIPEFYLSYMGDSDGLDAKPFKQIVYTFNKLPKSNFIKSKATAYFPAGNEGEEYHVLYDENWKKLPSAIKLKSSKVLESFKKSYE